MVLLIEGINVKCVKVRNDLGTGVTLPRRRKSSLARSEPTQVYKELQDPGMDYYMAYLHIAL